MLFKMSLRNMRRSIKDYTIYFFTLVLGVAIFYVFNSLESQTVMMNVSNNTHQLMELMSGVMSVLSVFVAIVLGFLIIYASRFLMKRRKKEFGIYMTLGMGKGQISKILLVETLAIGALSLVVGLALGIVLSQLMSIFVANMFEADMTSFSFIFSSSAFFTTIGLFALIYLVVMLFNTVSISRQSLIKLIHSDKENEKVKVRNLAVSIIMFLVSVAILAGAYIGVNNVEDLTSLNLTVYIVMGIVGTFLLFWSMSGLALRVAMRFKKIYYKNLNSFVFRELNSKINTTVASMSIISILLFLTICIFSSGISIKSSLTAELHDLVPADIQVSQSGFDDEGEGYGADGVVNSMQALGVNLEETFDKYTTIDMYKASGVTYGKTIGRDILKDTAGLTDYALENMLSYEEDIVRVSEYNKLAKLYSNEEITIKEDEYAVVADYTTVVPARNRALKENAPKIAVGGRELKPNDTKIVDGFIEMYSNRVNTGVIIVPDDLDLSENKTRNFFVGHYSASDKSAKVETDKYLEDTIFTPEARLEYALDGSTKNEIYDASIGLGAMATFVGLYLGSVFLITSAALLGLKEISESSDNQEKYKTLRDLGVDQKALNGSLFAQIAIFFGLPLLIACVHSIFGIMFATQILMSFANMDLSLSIAITAVFILAIYGGYFLITYFTSKRIVMSKD